MQIFFKRQTVYIPTVLVGAYFSNEVRSTALDGGGGGATRRWLGVGAALRHHILERRC